MNTTPTVLEPVAWNGSRSWCCQQPLGHWLQQHVRCLFTQSSWMDNTFPNSATRIQTNTQSLYRWCQLVHQATSPHQWLHLSLHGTRWHQPMAWHLMCNWGSTEHQKSFWSNLQFRYDKNGTPHIHQHMPTDPQLYLANLNRTQDTLHSTKPHEGIRHLGVHISMDGNHKAKERILLKHCCLFCTVFNQCPLTRAEAVVTYKTIFLLTITYPFPATSSLKLLWRKLNP